MCCRFPTVIGEECAVCNGNRTAAYRQASPHSAFAPSYQEVRRIDGKFVNTQRPLLFNYVFVRASERDVFQLMQRFPVLSFLPRVRERKREYFPYLSDAAMENLQWVARSYSNTLPVYIPQPDGLRKGDRIRITEGRFKGWRRLLSFSREPGERM